MPPAGEIPLRSYRLRSAALLWLTLPFAAGIGAGYAWLNFLPPSLLLVCAATTAAAALGLTLGKSGQEVLPPAQALPQTAQTPPPTQAPVSPAQVSLELAPTAKDAQARENRFRNGLWSLLFVVGVFLCGAAYAQLRDPPPGPFLEVPREAELTLQIDRLFAANREDGFVSGIGKVIDAPRYLPGINGQKVSFSVWTNPHFNRDHPPLLPSGQIILKGRLSDFDTPAPPPRKDQVARQGKTAAAGKTETIDANERNRTGFRAFLRSQGVRYGLDSGSILAVTHAGTGWRQLCSQIKSQLQAALFMGANDAKSQRLASIGSAMLLGDTSLLPPEDRSAFTVSGTMHLFAVSGLHVVLIAAAFAAAGDFCGFRRLQVAVVGILLLWVYVQVVGAPPSATRAWWMSSLFWAAMVLRRQHSPLSALCASMLIILLISPRDLLAIGFQLSYSVVAGILLYALPLAADIENWSLRQLAAAHLKLRRYPVFPPRPWYLLGECQRRNLLSLFTISLVGTLYSTPLVLGIFGNFAPAGLLVNLLLVPLSFWVLCALLLACVFGLPGLLWPASLFNHAAWLLLAFMSWAASLALISPAGFYTNLAWRWPQYGTVATILLLIASFVSHSRMLQPRTALKLSLVPLVWLALLLIGLL